MKNNEIKDLQRDLRKLKKLHEDTTKEVNELRQTAIVKQSQNHETTQSFAPLQFAYQAIPFNKSSEAILLEVSISFQQLNSQLSQNIQIFQLLETEFIASTKLTLHSSPKRHKYLTQLDPAQEEKIERHDPSMNFTPGISKSIQNVLEMAKLTLYEAVSLLEQIFVSVCIFS